MFAKPGSAPTVIIILQSASRKRGLTLLVLGYHPQLLVCKGQRPVPASQYELPCFRKLPREWKFPEISEISTPLDFVSWKLLNYKNTRMHQKARAPRGSNQPKALHDT